MIKTAMQLKAKVRNLSGSDSRKAQTLIRNFVMERFLERLSLSRYRNNFVLKGGMLVAAVVGLDTRATMDIDTTVRALRLDVGTATKAMEEIINVPIPDGVQFRITKAAEIMEEHDYHGIRFMIEAALEQLRQPIKIDISTGDAITPAAVEYTYELMFEDRSISIWTYNMETLMAEKLETILSRGTANTRMRDFYDIYVLDQQKRVDQRILKEALYATAANRNTVDMIMDHKSILSSVENSDAMRAQWERFREDSFFVGDLSWGEVMESVRALAESIL